jgi:EmrB/QacA subfamily drug resistance transporter
MPVRRRSGPVATLVVVSVALFMVTLDNLVVSTALPSLRVDLHAGLQGLQWIVNAYTLAFAVLLLPAAALGDRLGRRRVFAGGLMAFTIASAAAALAPSISALIAARAFQGASAAFVMPLSLTLLSEAFPAGSRGLALGIWSGVSGVGVALGPLAGGAVVEGISWHWIFWLNVPIGLVLVPLAYARLEETHGADSELDLPGLGLASVGLLGVVWALVRGNDHGWTSVGVVTPFVAGALVLAAFVWWESRTTSPMLPLEFFRDRTFTLTNVASLLMFFGMFGSIFFLAQFFQTVQGYSPLQSGLRILPWTAMPIFIAPIAGAMSDRIGGQRLMAAGLSLQAAGLIWIAAVSTPTLPYSHLVAPFVLSGVGMSLFFAPVANVVLSAVRPDQEGKASGANNAIRELGGVFGVAVLASIFSHVGGYQSGEAFVHGTTTAVYVGGGIVALGAVAAALIPSRRVREGAAVEAVLRPSL